MLKTPLLGTYGQISSWAAAIEPNVLADCKRCFNRRISVLLLDRHSASQIRPCQHCCQWDLCSTSDTSKRIPVPEKYPRICAPDSPDPPVGRKIGLLFLVPVRQHFEWLIRAVAVATHNVTLDVWNQGVMEMYLLSCAVATSVHVII